VVTVVSPVEALIEAAIVAMRPSLSAQTKGALLQYLHHIPAKIQGLTPEQRTAAVAKVNVLIALVEQSVARHTIPWRRQISCSIGSGR
jgi:hypothetical protein